MRTGEKDGESGEKVGGGGVVVSFLSVCGRHRPYRNHIGLGLVVGVVHVGVEGISGVVVVSCVELSDDDEGVGGTQGSAHRLLGRRGGNKCRCLVSQRRKSG